MTKKNTPSSNEVLDPINIARARHASAYTPSVANESYQPADTSKAKKGKRNVPSSPLGEMNGCLLVTIISVIFLVGSILGGIVGGGIVLMVSEPNQIALFAPLATATVRPTLTPAPADTPTPNPMIKPDVIPVIEEVIVSVTQSVVTVVNKHNHELAYNDDGRVVGSGIIIDSRGYIATNYHVIKNPGQLSIVLSDGREIEAELIASKADQDLAVLKISLINLPAIHWGDSTKIRQGQTVYALGSPLGDFPNSVSVGIVSGLNRALEMDGYVIDSLIQTDAAINRGSSGGPLINTRGDVIGLNTFIIRESEERGIAEGIAFAIPAKVAQDTLMPWVVAHSAEAEAIPAGN
jgi:2-alkenal reductase